MNITCSECEEPQSPKAYYTNGKQGYHSKCKGCWKRQGINGYQGELKVRFLLDNDPNVKICYCGRFYTQFQINNWTKKPKGAERRACTICVKKEASS
jgi:hypothetical protein